MRTVVITGGNTGLGWACARSIVRAGGWHVVLACRSPERAAGAVRRLTGEGDAPIEALPLDLAELDSIRRFAGLFASGARPPLHALVCNAGLQVLSGSNFTVDGFERTFAVNHLGHFLLTNLLLPAIAPPGRVVFVASGTHDPSQRTGMPAPRLVDARSAAHPAVDASEEPGLAGRRAYTTSKLCNVLCAYELARRLPPEGGVTVNAFDPGLMPGSGLARDYGPWQRFAWRFVLPALTLFVQNVNSVGRSGANLAALVLDPRFEHVTGRYYEGTRTVPSSRQSYDAELARALWDDSAALVGLGAPQAI